MYPLSIFLFCTAIALCNSSELSCPEGSFICGNGRCIENVKVCDGFLDCNDKDASDENLKTCFARRGKCVGIQFECPRTNICLWPFELCDGTNQCGDYSDENLEFCKAHKCPAFHMQCPNGRCVPQEWFCNGKSLCQNETWERENIKCADDKGQKACFGKNAFKCDNGKCLSRIGVCDGVDQCGDGSDEALERHCGNRTCLEHEFYCHSNTHRSSPSLECIPKSFACDGSIDCPEGEDEAEELCGKPLLQNLIQIPIIQCTQGFFQCSNFRCINESRVCDGAFDCNDKDISDESSSTCSTQPIKCTGDMLKCSDTNICIWPWNLCDGINQCGDYSDEDSVFCRNAKIPDNYIRCPSGRAYPESWFCNGKVLCEQPWESENIKCTDASGKKICHGNSTFQCDNGACIPRFELCDGKNTCGDNSDESPKQNCGKRACLDHEFYCHSNANSSKPRYECIPKAWTCDQAIQCPEGEDEAEELCGIAPNISCNKGDFRCNNSQCILAIGECNGILECMDGSDEHSACPPMITIFTETDGVNSFQQSFRADDPEFIDFQDDAKLIKTIAIIYSVQYALTAVVMVFILYRLFFAYRNSVYMPFLTAIMILSLIMTVGSFVFFAPAIFPGQWGQPCRLQKFVNGLEGFSAHWLWAAMYFQRYVSIFYPLVRMKQDGIWKFLNSTKFLIGTPIIIAFCIALWAASQFTVHDRHIGNIVQTWCRRDSIIISEQAQQVISLAVDCWKFLIPFIIILYLDFAVVFRNTKETMFAAKDNAHSARIESKERSEITKLRRQQNIKTCLIIVTIEILLNLPLRLHTILYVHFHLYEISGDMAITLAIIMNTMYTIQLSFKAIAVHLLCRSYRPKAKFSTTTPKTYSTSLPSAS